MAQLVNSVVEELSAKPYLWAGIGLTSTLFVLDSLYLSYRELSSCYNGKGVPTELQGKMSHEQLVKAREYKRDTMTYGLYHSTWSHVISTTMLIMGWLPFLWKSSESVVTACNLPLSPISQTIAFFVLSNVVDIATELPWTIYHTFVLEAKHGFNKQTPWFFFKDQVKSFLLNNALTAVFISALLYIIDWAGANFFFYVWVFVFGFSLLMMTLYPDFIAPLFDTFTELPTGPLRDSIETLAASLQFPLKKLYLVANSVRSSHSNAYFFGWGNNKRIVLFDTLLSKDLKPESDDKDGDKDDKDDKDDKEDGPQGCNVEEITAVLAHELGHWSHGHVMQMFAIQQSYMLLMFYLFQQLNTTEAIYVDYGFTEDKPVVMGLLIIFGYLLSPLSTVFGLGITLLIRKNEFQADRFAAQQGRAESLQAALIKLSTDNKSYPYHDWLHSTIHRSHPPLLERLEALKKMQ
eukprot:m.209409 g.209409  ORF g.209409 m.209409 type:complete len:463 (-) comp17140_c2_seq3:1899-3287(-)